MADTAQIVSPSEVPDETPEVLIEAIRSAGLAGNRVVEWYHDDATWLVVEPEDPDGLYRFLQIAVVRERGRLFLEIHAESRRVVQSEVLVQPFVEPTRRPVEELRVSELAEQLRELWGGSAAKPPGDDPQLVAVPLSRSLVK